MPFERSIVMGRGRIATQRRCRDKLDGVVADRTRQGRWRGGVFPVPGRPRNSPCSRERSNGRSPGHGSGVGEGRLRSNSKLSSSRTNGNRAILLAM